MERTRRYGSYFWAELKFALRYGRQRVAPAAVTLLCDCSCEKLYSSPTVNGKVVHLGQIVVYEVLVGPFSSSPVPLWELVQDLHYTDPTQEDMSHKLVCTDMQITRTGPTPNHNKLLLMLLLQIIEYVAKLIYLPWNSPGLPSAPRSIVKIIIIIIANIITTIVTAKVLHETNLTKIVSAAGVTSTNYTNTRHAFQLVVGDHTAVYRLWSFQVIPKDHLFDCSTGEIRPDACNARGTTQYFSRLLP